MRKAFTLAMAAMAAAGAARAIPPGFVRKPVAGQPEIALYERASPPPMPSFWQQFLALFQVPGGTTLTVPFQRSVAVIVGIGHYRYMTPDLAYVSNDVGKLADFLLGEGRFDAAYVTSETISPQAVDVFMSDAVPRLLQPTDRLLFYFSGHGADPGSGKPVLLFQQARPGEWGQNVLRVDEYEQWSGLIKARHAVFIYDACTAGEAALAKAAPETRTAVTELSGNGSRIVVTAGTAKQQAWVMAESSRSQYSIFTAALIRALREGTEETNRRGFMTIGQAVEEAGVLVADTTRRLGPGHEMSPSVVKIEASRYKGTFVFLSAKADHPQIPQSDMLAMGMVAPKGAGNVAFEREEEEVYWKSVEALNDPELFAKVCQQWPDGLFCPVAKKKMELLRARAKAAPETPAVDLTKLDRAALERMASEGSVKAMTQLGKAYESGLQGAAADMGKSLTYYREASDRGDGEAAFRLGQIYNAGRPGVARDDAQAVAWYLKAAEAGNNDGMVTLGVMYMNSSGGLAQNDVEAVRWFRRAADAGDGRGASYLGFMYGHGRGGLALDEAEAVRWYRKGAEAGDSYGMTNMGVMSRYGRGGLKADEAQAVAWYRKAAEAGSAVGMAYLGEMYELGLGGLATNPAEAVQWYQRSAAAGEGRGMADLGRMYEAGLGGVAKNEAQAVAWYRKATETGNGTGMAYLGYEYEHGLGGLKADEAQAVVWYRKSAAAGDGAGMSYLGYMYEHGRGGLKMDLEQAVAWYRNAAALGDSFGAASLKRLGR